jgi:hypothetical protein
MPPQQAWASRQFQDCDSDGKSRAVQCKWCIEKKVAYNSTSRKTSHLKQCVAFNDHVVQLVEAENAGGYLCRELEQMPSVVLEAVLDQTGSRRLQQGHVGQGAVGMGSVNGNLGPQAAAVLFGNANLGAQRMNPVNDTPRSERPTPSSALRAGANSISHVSTPSTVPQRGAATNFNRAQIDRAFASALNHPSTTSPALQTHQTPNQSAMQPPNGPDVSTLLNSFNSNTDPRISDALRLLDKDTRVRIARELLDEAYDGVKRAVDNYIEKQQYLNAILEDGAEMGADEQGR